jgi:hypothetical protein
MSGDEAWQHSGIGRLYIARDKRDAQARHRLHAEALQDMDVSVSAADEDEVFDDRRDTHDSDLRTALTASSGPHRGQPHDVQAVTSSTLQNLQGAHGAPRERNK